MKVRRIEPKFDERVWGRTDLRPFYGSFGKPVGEVRFDVRDDFPLLVKFIFTDERLSVQVHPDDTPGARGKTEMWHILDAAPNATVGLGFREPVTERQLRAAIEDGSVESLIEWVPVQAGDTLYTPARTVHAIGAGIVLCEIQQNSDCTYRLWDYNRGRELHIEQGLAVCDTGVCDGFRQLPVVTKHFITDEIDPEAPSGLEVEHLLITLAGSGMIDGSPYRAGEVWHVPAGFGLVDIQPAAPSRIIRTRCGS
jgi:mannose-6-phosphate isomerase